MARQTQIKIDRALDQISLRRQRRGFDNRIPSNIDDVGVVTRTTIQRICARPTV